MGIKESDIEDQIDLKELFFALWSAKKFIIQLTAIFAIGSIGLSLILTPYYKSESLLLVRNGSDNQGLSQLSSLAAIAGVNMSSSGNDQSMQAIELIKSREFMKHLLTFDNILPSMLAAESYDPNAKELLFDQNKYNPDTKEWSNKPSYLKAHKFFLKQMLNISKNNKNGFISIHIEHISPIFAKEFLDLIIAEANEILRNKDMEESKQGIKYLTSELSKTPFIEIQGSINALIEAQLETQMMTQINQDYLLVKIEPPFIPEDKSKPSRAMISIIGTMLGGMISILIVLIRYFLDEREDT